MTEENRLNTEAAADSKGRHVSILPGAAVYTCKTPMVQTGKPIQVACKPILISS